MTDEGIVLKVNKEEIIQDLKEIKEEGKAVTKTVEKIVTEAKYSFTQIIGGVHAVWLATQGAVRAAGGSIETVFRTLIGTSLSTVAILAPLLSAQAVTPGMQIQAALGFASLGLAISALVAAEAEEKEFSDALRGANMALHGIQSFIGVFNF